MNLQRGRSDLRGAGRLAVFVFAARMASWLLQAQHAGQLDSELGLLLFALVGGLVEVLLLWLLYVALEPYARRYWPHLLVSWTRLLRGQVRDPLVGAHVLLGAVLGAGWGALQALERPLALWLGLSTRGVLRADSFYAGLLNTRYALAGDLDVLRSCIYQGLSFLLLLVLLRMILRRPAVTAVVGALLIMPLLVPRGSNAFTSWLLLGAGGVGLLTWFMVRFGLLTVVTGMYVALVLARAPLTIHLGEWYGDLSVIALVVVSAIALFGFLAARVGGEARLPARG
jgi:serine/threonine-protein kinase